MQEMKEFKPEMHRSYLIQRLVKPHALSMKIGGKQIDNPFCFGGGLVNGGLSDKAMDLFREIFSFDYMGAAEFEFGSIPAAFNAIAKEIKKYTTFTISLKRSDLGRPSWLSWGPANEQLEKDKAFTEIRKGSAEIYVFCRKEHEEEVRKRLLKMAHGKERDTKEYVGLRESILPDPTSTSRHNPHGWIEIDNGFMFFTDKEMATKTCGLFGLKLSPH